MAAHYKYRQNSFRFAGGKKHCKMAPKLYAIAASPPVRAVQACAKAINLELEVINVNLLAGEHLKPEYLKVRRLVFD